MSFAQMGAVDSEGKKKQMQQSKGEEKNQKQTHLSTC